MEEFSMDNNFYTLLYDETWFSDAFSKRPTTFESRNAGNHVWELREKLSERCMKRDGKPEAVAVFQVVQMRGPKAGQGAILKIHMQIPLRNGPHFRGDPKVRSELAGDLPFHEGLNEIEALRILTESDCPATPRLFASRIDKQDETMWVPGGYIIYALMEKLPGRTIHFHDFCEWPREKRDELREVFLVALSKLIQLGVEPGDPALRNILWDDENKKCYLIDFEEWVEPEDNALEPDGRVANAAMTLAFWQLVWGSLPNYEW